VDFATTACEASTVWTLAHIFFAKLIIEVEAKITRLTHFRVMLRAKVALDSNTVLTEAVFSGGGAGQRRRR
jgi:hypothetical protein